MPILEFGLLNFFLLDDGNSYMDSDSENDSDGETNSDSQDAPVGPGPAGHAETSVHVDILHF